MTIWSPKDKNASIALSNNNLTATATATAWKSVRANAGKSTGKFYFEYHIDSAVNAYLIVGVGTLSASLANWVGSDNYGWGFHNSSPAVIRYGGNSSSYGSQYLAGDVVSVAIDLDAHKIWFGINGVWQNSGNPETGVNPAFSNLSGEIYPMVSIYSGGNQITAHFATASLTYTPPAGFGELVGLTLALTLSESLVADQFLVTVFDADTGDLNIRTVLTAPGGVVDMTSHVPTPVFVTLYPDIGSVWKPSQSYAINAKVFPTNPISTPYYYKRLTAGTSGTTEPTWPTTPGGQCDDGAVTNAWELVEHLVQPITNGPLIPS